MLARCCWLLLGSVFLATTGCAMCSSCDDYCYTGSGGTWERLDQCWGRVGSAFTPEVSEYVGGYDDENLLESTPGSLPAGEPTPVDDPAPAPPSENDENDAEPPAGEVSVLQDSELISR